MRFLADMGVDLRVVRWLREQGHDAVHLRDENLQRLPDEEIFTKARRESRVIVTFDLDFGEIAARSAGQPASVIVFRLRNTRTPHVIDRLAVALRTSGGALSKGAVVAVEESRLRVRYLPVGRSPE